MGPFYGCGNYLSNRNFTSFAPFCRTSRDGGEAILPPFPQRRNRARGGRASLARPKNVSRSKSAAGNLRKAQITAQTGGRWDSTTAERPRQVPLNRSQSPATARRAPSPHGDAGVGFHGWAKRAAKPGGEAARLPSPAPKPRAATSRRRRILPPARTRPGLPPPGHNVC
jgi:hypothetical protein